MKDQFRNFKVPYEVNEAYKTPVTYMCMEYGIDQSLKIFSGGLGFLAGSHMRAAYDLRQNLIGIGMLWKFGYYDQSRTQGGLMRSDFIERFYNFLEDTGIKLSVLINGHDVYVKAFYLAPEVFGTAPMFLLTTDLPENDHLARTICHRLYDNNPEAKVAQSIILGVGGAKLLEVINWTPNVYHLNEAHALPAIFHLYSKNPNLEALRERVVLTTHTPVEAGNEKHNIHLLNKMSFFGRLPLSEVRKMTGFTNTDTFNHTLAALRFSKIANGVSKIHGEVARKMWGSYDNICEITHITNSQHFGYWHDPALYEAMKNNRDAAFDDRKRAMRADLCEEVADQTGKHFNPNYFTLVWARRFAGYKRADLITRDMARFERLLSNSKYPIQIIWLGKPYPMDYGAIDVWNYLSQLSHKYPNVAVLTGYELKLSATAKKGSDVWLNNPRIPREASGTSGMTAAMNGSLSLSTYDGWIAEFVRHGENGYVIPKVNLHLPQSEQDERDRVNLMNVLENEILPTFYDHPAEWRRMVQTAMTEIAPQFDSTRMAREYYEQVYNVNVMANA